MRLVDAFYRPRCRRRVHLQPVVAEVVIFRVRRHLFFINDGGDGVERIFSATAGTDVGGPVQRRGMIVNFFSWLAMLSGCQPSTLRINAGDLFSVTARVYEKITSSGRSGLPEANLASGFSLMVRVFAAGSACQLSARIGTIFQGCCGPAAPDAGRGWGPSECWRVRSLPPGRG